jgi:tRNA (mo5U34)-methyltransferase
MNDNAATPKDAMGHLRDAVQTQLGTRTLAQLDNHYSEYVRFSQGLPASHSTDERARLVQKIEELEPWLQGPFALGGDLVIRGAWHNDERWRSLAPYVPDLVGKRILDVGSNAGYDAFMFKLQGAAEVLACEPFDFIRQMEFLESVYRSGITPCRLPWQKLDPAIHGTFDLVHCHGVLYHEMHPMALLQRLRTMLNESGTLLFGSMMLADPELSEYARFVPNSYFGDPTWWWVPGRLAMRWMLESIGLEIESVFGVSPGPPGEFETVNGYFKLRCGKAAGAVTFP